MFLFFLVCHVISLLYVHAWPLCWNMKGSNDAVHSLLVEVSSMQCIVDTVTGGDVQWWVCVFVFCSFCETHDQRVYERLCLSTVTTSAHVIGSVMAALSLTWLVFHGWLESQFHSNAKKPLNTLHSINNIYKYWDVLPNSRNVLFSDCAWKQEVMSKWNYKPSVFKSVKRLFM